MLYTRLGFDGLATEIETLRDEEGEYEPPAVIAGDPRTFFTYNLDHNLARVDGPDGAAIVLGYDPAGRLGTVTTPRGVTTQSYSPFTGNVASTVAPGGFRCSSPTAEGSPT